MEWVKVGMSLLAVGLFFVPAEASHGWPSAKYYYEDGAFFDASCGPGITNAMCADVPAGTQLVLVDFYQHAGMPIMPRVGADPYDFNDPVTVTNDDRQFVSGVVTIHRATGISYSEPFCGGANIDLALRGIYDATSVSIAFRNGGIDGPAHDCSTLGGLTLDGANGDTGYGEILFRHY